MLTKFLGKSSLRRGGRQILRKSSWINWPRKWREKEEVWFQRRHLPFGATEPWWQVGKYCYVIAIRLSSVPPLLCEANTPPNHRMNVVADDANHAETESLAGDRSGLPSCGTDRLRTAHSQVGGRPVPPISHAPITPACVPAPPEADFNMSRASGVPYRARGMSNVEEILNRRQLDIEKLMMGRKEAIVFFFWVRDLARSQRYL
ncbi:hypothetical protein C8J57DRAFT_1476493 [Mycena rebaudengoi]|nr:hypothetical protein C8J57DRAFT_1476493 [Mycena rebaudengoi]